MESVPQPDCKGSFPVQALLFHSVGVKEVSTFGVADGNKWMGVGTGEKQQLAEVPRILSFYSAGPIPGPLTNRP